MKLALAPGFHLPDLSDVVQGVVVSSHEPTDRSTSYVDTGDLRLIRAGALLRHVSDEGWIVELPTGLDGPDGREESRTVLRVEGSAGSPPPAAVDLVRAFARRAPLVRVARIRTSSRRVDVLDEDHEVLTEIVDDEVSVFDGRRIALRFREATVTPVARGATDLATMVAERLRHAGAGRGDTRPEVVRVLGPRAREPLPERPDPDIGADASTRDVVAHTLAVSVERLVHHDPWVRIGRGPEDVHQARVAARRLRSDLRTFRSILDEPWQTELRDELRWVGAELGAVRDIEVLRERLGRRVASLPAREALPGRHILDDLDARHRDARADLLAAMRSERYVLLLDRLVDAVWEPRVGPDGDTPAAHVLPTLVSGPWKHLADTVASLGDHPTDEALHEVRIRAKRARYAAEAVAPAAPKRARSFARAATRVQDVLGEHQDACTAGRWLRNVARDAPEPVVFAAGMLAEKERRAANAARKRFPKAWRRLNAKKLRSWM